MPVPVKEINSINRNKLVIKHHIHRSSNSQGNGEVNKYKCHTWCHDSRDAAHKLALAQQKHPSWRFIVIDRWTGDEVNIEPATLLQQEIASLNAFEGQ